MRLDGHSRIAGRLAEPEGRRFFAENPATGTSLEPEFVAASLAQAHEACRAAANAAPTFAKLPRARHVALLRRLAANLLAHEAPLTARAHLETAIPEDRLRGEIARTAKQLTLFADHLENGDLFEPRFDPADGTRKPTPKPDLRSIRRPLGPVAVFGASNFPFAYSVLGCDTAAALAAGCPVVVKAHPSHPGTSALCGAIADSTLRECDLPAGFFSLLFDDGHDIGAALVRAPEIRAVAFTGSLRGGRALMDIAATRPAPIPVYAEMGANNPVILLPGALAARGAAIARDFARAITHGGGQFCTKPGLILALAGDDFENFARILAAEVHGAAPTTLLTKSIFETYEKLTAGRARTPGVTTQVDGKSGATPNLAAPRLYATDAATFRSRPELAHEIFGPTSLLVAAPDIDSLRTLVHELDGALVGALHAEPEETPLAREFSEILAERVGRIVFNGVTTGVEVSGATVHGGPYPATSDGRTSSVGTTAALRFTRRVCFQDTPAALLPDDLH